MPKAVENASLKRCAYCNTEVDRSVSLRSSFCRSLSASSHYTPPLHLSPILFYSLSLSLSRLLARDVSRPHTCRFARVKSRRTVPCRKFEMLNLLPSAYAQLKEDGEESHARPPFVHDHAADNDIHSTGPQMSSPQEVVAGPLCRPSTTEQYEESRGRRGNGETPGEISGKCLLGNSNVLSYVRHLISHSGNVLEQHHVVYEKQIFRAEQWLVFSTARPLSAVFKLKVHFHLHTGTISLSTLSLS